MVDDAEVDLPRGIGAPATRALTAAGYVRLDQVGSVPAQLGALHGVGPRAPELLCAALGARGMGLSLEHTRARGS